MAGLVSLLFPPTNHGHLSVVYNKKGLVEYRPSFVYSSLFEISLSSQIGPTSNPHAQIQPDCFYVRFAQHL